MEGATILNRHLNIEDICYPHHFFVINVVNWQPRRGLHVDIVQMPINQSVIIDSLV